jgi:hypothetical protein
VDGDAQRFDELLQRQVLHLAVVATHVLENVCVGFLASQCPSRSARSRRSYRNAWATSCTVIKSTIARTTGAPRRVRTGANVGKTAAAAAPVSSVACEPVPEGATPCDSPETRS